MIDIEARVRELEPLNRYVIKGVILRSGDSDVTSLCPNELLEVGRESIRNSIQNYDNSSGISFRTYVESKLKYDVIRAVKSGVLED